MKDLAGLLERETVEIPRSEESDALNQELAQGLAAQAAKVFGYTRLRTVIENKARTLGRVIQELGIETFTKESVKTYQAAVIEEKRQEVIAAQSWLGRNENSLCLVSLFIGCVSFVVFGFSNHALASSLVSLAIACVGFGVFLAISSSPSSDTIPFYRWQRFPLDRRYRKDVPEFALDKAIAIKKALPSSQIFVEECAEVKDPFLVAVNGDEEYYFAAYDEPKFEANLYT